MRQGDLAIFISQSGETADTLAALRYAKSNGVHTLSVVNVPTSTISRESETMLPTLAGPEIGVASTKAFTCQLMVLAAIAIAAGRARGELSDADEAKLVHGLVEIPRLMAAALATEPQIEKLARDIAKSRDVLYLGRGTSYPLALEGALKLKEISYIHAEGYAAGELKHGPIALIDENMPVVVIAPYDRVFEKTISNMQEVAARGGKIILMTDAKGAAEATIELAGDDRAAGQSNTVPVKGCPAGSYCSGRTRSARCCSGCTATTASWRASGGRRVADGGAAGAAGRAEPLVTTFDGHPWNWAAGGGHPHAAQLGVQPVERRQGPVVRPAAPGAGASRSATTTWKGRASGTRRSSSAGARTARPRSCTFAQLEEPVSYSLSEILAGLSYSERTGADCDGVPKTVIEVAGREVRSPTRRRCYFPRTGHTKLDLVRYYLAVAEGALRGGGAGGRWRSSGS